MVDGAFLLPDMQALKRDLIIHHKFALHQEFLISLCLISRWRHDKEPVNTEQVFRSTRCAAGWYV